MTEPGTSTVPPASVIRPTSKYPPSLPGVTSSAQPTTYVAPRATPGSER